MTGLTRGQVVRSALLESVGGHRLRPDAGWPRRRSHLHRGLTTTSAVTGSATLDLPWPLIIGVSALALVVTSVTSMITSWSATRRAPITLLGTSG